MKATKFTLVADTVTKIATGGVESYVQIQTALTDLMLGDANVGNDTATSFKFGTIATPVSLGKIQGDLNAFSHAGGVIYVLTTEAG